MNFYEIYGSKSFVPFALNFGKVITCNINVVISFLFDFKNLAPRAAEMDNQTFFFKRLHVFVYFFQNYAYVQTKMATCIDFVCVVNLWWT